jgi:hypothetical protein
MPAGNHQETHRESHRLGAACARRAAPAGARAKAQTFRFKDDGAIPEHPRWPLVVYRGAVRRDDGFDPPAVLREC